MRFNVTNDAILVSKAFYSTRNPMKLIALMRQKDKISQNQLRLPYDSLSLIESTNNEIIKARNNALADQRWRNLKAAYMFWSPDLFRKSDGSFTGSSYDIWSILMAKLDFSIDFSVFVKTVRKATDLLENKTIDLVLPHGSYLHSMFKVFFKANHQCCTKKFLIICRKSLTFRWLMCRHLYSLTLTSFTMSNLVLSLPYLPWFTH